MTWIKTLFGDINIRDSWMNGRWELYVLCNFSGNIKLFQNKNLFLRERERLRAQVGGMGVGMERENLK